MAPLHQFERKGQALVEFALIIGVLVMIIFVVIEAGHLLQANLTVQSAAREAGRYAITGRFDANCLTAIPPCTDPRVHSIKSVAEENLAGLSLNPDASFEEAGYYLVELFGTNANGDWVAESAGMPGRPILVRVTYRAPVLTPLLRPIAQTVMVTGQTIMNNERVVQVGSAGDTDAPPVPPPPLIEPTPQPPVDLVVAKQGPASAMENSPFNYRITVSNRGLRDAEGVQLSDTLDPGLTFVSRDAAECTGGASLVCSWPRLAVGESKTVIITVRANAGTAGQTIVNTASASFTGPAIEADLSNNAASVETDIVPFTADTDLAIAKTGPRAAPVSTASQAFFVDYKISVVNNGPNHATSVVVDDPLGGGLLFEPAGSSPGCSGSTSVTCNLGALAIGESRTLTIRARTPAAPGLHTNTATVSTASPGELNPSNNTANHAVEFVYIADLEITKTASSSLVNAGENLTFQLTVRNRPESPHTATGVHISDPLPAFVELQSATYTAPDGDGNCAVSGNVVTCPIGALEPGAGASATIQVIPTRAGTLVNSAQVAGEQNDPDTINSATAVTTVNATSDLSISKTVAPLSPFAGDIITYTITILNGGPSQATGVYMEDVLPSELIYQFAESDSGYCSWDGALHKVNCLLGTIPADAVATIWITAIPVVPDVEFVNTAYVYADNDPDEVNNSAAATTARRGDPFLVLDPACGPQETQVTIQGHDWSTQWTAENPRLITLTWHDDDGNSGQVAQLHPRDLAGGSFTVPFTLPPGAHKEELRIRAAQPSMGGGQEPSVDEAMFAIPCPAADLEPTAIELVTPHAEQYDPVDFTVTVHNTGNRAANHPFYVSLYAFETAQELPLTTFPEANRLDVAVISRLDAGQSAALTLRAHHGFPNAAAYYIYALVDSDPSPEGAIREMAEDNNIVEAVVAIAAREGGLPPDPPTGTQSLSGETLIATDPNGASSHPQPMVRVTVYDAAGGIRLASTLSNSSAVYQFSGLPSAATYYAEATITIDGVTYAFSGLVSPAGQTLLLYAQQESR